MNLIFLDCKHIKEFQSLPLVYNLQSVYMKIAVSGTF